MNINSERTILHVDDDPAITAIIAKQLSRHGYTAHGINDSELAIAELAHGRYRVVLLDIDMPKIDGMTLLRSIKEYDGGIQVLMLTGLVSLSTALETLRAGAEACVFKPVEEIEPLIEALDDAFRKLDRWWKTLDEQSRRKKQHVQV